MRTSWTDSSPAFLYGKRVHILVAALCAVGVVLALSCGSEGPTSPKYVPLKIAITGTVTDSETHAGIDNVLIQANEFSSPISNEPILIAETRTDSDGRYELKFEVNKSTCREGKYRLWFLKDSYETGPGSGDIKCTSDVQVINIQLIPQQ